MNIKRSNLVITEDLFNEIQDLANERHTNFLETCRYLLKLGLYIYKQKGTLILRNEDKEKEIIFL